MYYNSTTIEIFLSTAHTHSFTKTAEQYYMSQQAVSKRIIEFERECGVQLFLRTTKSLELTPAGKELFTFFSREQSELNRLLRKLQEQHEKQPLQFTVGVGLRFELGDYITRSCDLLKKKLPEAAIIFVHKSGHELTQMLGMQQIDAMISFKGPGNDDFSSEEILTAQRVLLVSRDDPKAGPNATARDFEDEPVLLYRNENTRDDAAEIENFFRMNNPEVFNPRHVLVVPSEADAKLDVKMGRGVTLSSTCNALTDSPEFRQYSLEDSTPIYIIWNRDNLKPHLELLIQAFRENGDNFREIESRVND